MFDHPFRKLLLDEMRDLVAIRAMAIEDPEHPVPLHPKEVLNHNVGILIGLELAHLQKHESSKTRTLTWFIVLSLLVGLLLLLLLTLFLLPLLSRDIGMGSVPGSVFAS